MEKKIGYCYLLVSTQNSKQKYKNINWLHKYKKLQGVNNITSKFFVCFYWNAFPGIKEECVWFQGKVEHTDFIVHFISYSDCVPKYQEDCYEQCIQSIFKKQQYLLSTFVWIFIKNTCNGFLLYRFPYVFNYVNFVREKSIAVN